MREPRVDVSRSQRPAGPGLAVRRAWALRAHREPDVMRPGLHALLGAAVGSSFPVALAAALSGNPAWMLLAVGVALAPDLFDFLSGHGDRPDDVIIVPDPAELDLQLVADALAELPGRIDSQCSRLCIRLHGVPGVAAWRHLSARYNVAAGRVEVSCDGETAIADLARAVEIAEAGVLEVIDGPGAAFVLEDAGAGRVRMTPRRIVPGPAHTVVAAVAAGGLTGLLLTPWAGCMVAAVWVLHLVADALSGVRLPWLYPFAAVTLRDPIRDARRAALLVCAAALLVLAWNILPAAGGRAGLDGLRFVVLGALALLVVPATLPLASRSNSR